MALANLNKCKELVTNTNKASKYMPKRPRICINGNPPFRPHFLNFQNLIFFIITGCGCLVEVTWCWKCTFQTLLSKYT